MLRFQGNEASTRRQSATIARLAHMWVIALVAEPIKTTLAATKVKPLKLAMAHVRKTVTSVSTIPMEVTFLTSELPLAQDAGSEATRRVIETPAFVTRVRKSTRVTTRRASKHILPDVRTVPTAAVIPTRISTVLALAIWIETTTRPIRTMAPLSHETYTLSSPSPRILSMAA